MTRQTESAARTTTATINLPADLHRLLRRAALARAEREGGRASVSAVIVQILEQHRAELEKEARQ